ncbi:MAG TPA: response regulator transcription factor [Candidatus Micrarchaeia archaeon]|nr:response regulator transcription factor [Candidatus Micrarchaeia archaeon]
MPDNWIESVGQGPAAEPGKRLRILVLEDEPLFRDLLVRALDRPGLRVVGAFATAPEALEAAPHVRPDVAILDIELAGGWTGIRVGVQMRQLVPRVGVLLLSNHADAELLSGVRPEELAGWSYLLKRSVADVSALVRAIEGAAAGLVVLDPQLLKRRSSRLSGPLGTLTPRQLQVLDLIAQGYTNSGIAEQLGLAEKSVENQINLLYQALAIDRADGSLHVRVQAVLTYLGHRLES